MSLYATWVRFADEATDLSTHFRAFASSGATITTSSHFSLPDECLLEGLLSRLWQSWGSFWRTCIVESCMGTVDGTGGHIPPHASAASDGHVSQAVINAGRRGASSSYWGGVNTTLRHEPTWGDVDVLARVLPRLGPSNASQLVAAASAASQSAKPLQRIRNAAAHNNSQTMAEVLAIRSSYVVFHISHPIQALYWTEPSSSDFLVTAALDDLVDCAFTAIS